MASTGAPQPRHRGAPQTGSTATLVITLALVGVLVLLGMLVRVIHEQDPPPRLLVVFAYSALDDVLHDGLLPAFRRSWQEAHGEDVELVTTYGGSRALTERILEEVPVQVAILTSTLDAERLVPRVVRRRAWEDLPHGGILARTPLVLRVRDGNPHGIAGFDDLARAGLEVLRPDPATSGLGECTLLAAYGAALRSGRDGGGALDLLRDLQAASPGTARTAREAARRFQAGEGDVCVAYEHDTVGTPSHPPLSGEVVTPRSTLLCEPVVVVVRRHVDEEERALVTAFTDFLWSDEGRRILTAYGFHAPTTPAAELAEDAFTLADLEAPQAVLDAATVPPPTR